MQSVLSICQENSLSKSTLYNWIHLYSEIKTPKGKSLTSQQMAILERRIRRLEVELEVYKRSKCTVDSPLETKLAAIENLYQELGVRACCRVLEVRRSTFYHYLFRSPEQTLVEKDDEMLKPVIKEMFDSMKGRVGAKKIRVCMMNQGYTISVRRVSRLMKELNLVCVSSKKNIKYNFTPKSNFRNNRLNRKFTQEKPNRVWVSDITTLYVNYKPYYLCIIIDLFSRKVLAFSIESNQDTPMVLAAFKDAYKSRNCPFDLTFHSDQGGQYISYDFRKYLRSKRINQSFSNPGSPHDNAVAESFFRTIKAEETRQHFYYTSDELKSSVAEYIGFFNDKRPHLKLGYKTPNQVEEEYFIKRKSDSETGLSN